MIELPRAFTKTGKRLATELGRDDQIRHNIGDGSLMFIREGDELWIDTKGGVKSNVWKIPLGEDGAKLTAEIAKQFGLSLEPMTAIWGDPVWKVV